MNWKNFWFFILFVVGVIVIYVVLISGNSSGPYAVARPPEQIVHWHSDVELEVCGKTRPDLLMIDFDAGSRGTHLLHTHGDNKIHIEEKIIWKKEDIALGKFFDSVGLKFSESKLLDKVNGDECSAGKQGNVKMFVNGKENFEFRNYVPNDGDKIKLIFE